MLRASLKSLLSRKLRLLLTALAVVLGVGFTAGTLVLTDTAIKSFDALFGDVFKGTDVVVQAKNSFTPSEAGGTDVNAERNPVTQAVYEQISSVPGVAAADGDVGGFAQLVDPSTGKVVQNGQAPTLGNSWDPHVTTLQVVQGSPPSGPGQIAVDAGTAGSANLRLGEQVRVVTPAGTAAYAVSGIVKFGSSNSLLGAMLVLFDLPTAQKVFDRAGVYDFVYVVGDPGTSPVALARRIQTVLPAGYQAITGDAAASQQASEVNQGLGFLRTALLVFAFVSLFVGAFIIFNTFNIIVTQRTRELALLRALGASRRQVMTSVLVESATVGLVASIVGVAVGLGLAELLKGLLSALGLELPSTALVVARRTIVAGLAVGTLVTVAASVSPARRASRVAPVEALRESSAPSASLRRRVIVGGLVTAVGVGLLLFGLFGKPSKAALAVGLGAQLTFIGVAVIAPLFARPLAAAIGRPLRGSVSGKLGRENSMRNPRRTASTSAALMIGLGLVTFVAVFAASVKTSAASTLDRILKADFTLATTSFQPFSPQVAKDLSTNPAFSAVSPLRQAEAKVGGSSTFVVGVDPTTITKVTNIAMDGGSVSSLSQPGTVIVSKSEASAKHFTVGGRLTMRFARTGDVSLRVVGLFEPNQLLNDYAVSLTTYDANFAQSLDSVVFLKDAPGVSPGAARAAVDRELVNYPGVEASDQQQFKKRQSDAINKFFGLVYGLLFLSVIISFFGIVNTLGLSIYERVRELGLLRAVGMSRRQVRRMVRVEAVIVSLLGAVLGLVIGVLFGWAMQRALASLGIDRFSVPAGLLAFFLAAAGALGVVAAIWPARKAANLDVLEAVSYE